MSDIDLSSYVLDFGKKHRGKRIQRVPVSYLRWMVNAGAGPWKIARAELDRRGSTFPEIEITGHAIDSASLRIRRTWHQNRLPTEGLHAWLARAAIAAGLEGRKLEGDAVAYLNVKWIIESGAEFPILKTVMPMPRENRDGVWKAQLDDLTCDACRERHGWAGWGEPIGCTGGSSDEGACRCVFVEPTMAEPHPNVTPAGPTGAPTSTPTPESECP